MGAGSSTAEIDAHVRKWDEAINALQALTNEHKRALHIDTVDNRHNKDLIEKNEAASNLDIKAAHSFEGMKVSIQHHPMDSSGGSASISLAQTMNEGKKKVSRTHERIARTNRLQFFSSYLLSDETRAEFSHAESTVSFAGSQFASAALALSQLLGGASNTTDRAKKVTVEDLFFAANIPLNGLYQQDWQLAEMYDVVRDFVSIDSRFKNDYSVECIFLDVRPSVGQVDRGRVEVGQRQYRRTLPELRQQIEEDLATGNASYIVNFDPFIVEQEVRQVEGADEDDEGQTETMANASLEPGQFGLSITHEKGKMALKPGKSLLTGGDMPSQEDGINFVTMPKTVSNANAGMFSVVADMRQRVSDMVTLCEATVVHSQIQGNLIEIPFKALYEAMTFSSEHSCFRPRGVIRISHRDVSGDKLNEETNVGWFYSDELCSGKVFGTTLNGINANVINFNIPPHLVASAWAFHFIGGTQGDSCHGHGRGLPVGDIIRTVGLPHDVFLETDLPLDQVHMYLCEYIALKGMEDAYSLVLCPVLTKVNRANAVPTQSLSDLEATLIELEAANDDPECPSHIMIVQFNSFIARNEIKPEHGIMEKTSWGVVVGYNSETNYVRVIDGRAKRNCTTWTLRLDRLHEAVTDYGYMILASKAKPEMQISGQVPVVATASPVGQLRSVPYAVARRFSLLEKQRKKFHVGNDLIKTFAFPRVSLPITVAAAALTRLGRFTVVDSIVHESSIEVNALLRSSTSPHMFKRILEDYLDRTGLTNDFSIEVVHCAHKGDKKTARIPTKEPLLNFSAFCELIRKSDFSETAKSIIIVHFDSTTIKVVGDAHPFGDYAVVTGMEERQDGHLTVCVNDANPNAFYRSWEMPVEVLFEAMTSRAADTYRTRGIVCIHKKSAAEKEASAKKDGRSFDLSVVPLQFPSLISASPHVQCLSIAFAQLGHYFSPEEIFYEAFLKTASVHRRRASQAVAWRSVDISMTVLNKYITSKFLAQMANSFIGCRNAPNLHARQEISEPDAVLAMFVDATSPNADHVLCMKYDVETIHGIDNLGHSMGIVQSYNAEEKTVTILEAEFAVFGRCWTVSTDDLFAANRKSCEGTEGIDLIIVETRESSDSDAASPGSAFTQFAPAAF